MAASKPAICAAAHRHPAADYIAEHVTLGYAATIDSAQGLTAGRRDTKAAATSSARTC
ncbi:hypothetical protein [Mycolicibacterium frederiksbergense]|uniref:hypothetical protein n=1 Tax=Mycolicibacterium frederiksbergense TaxID=117567 RepID=UPI001F27CBB1|nr:hypothetical protein [Mycolicibacterium frederiksbergense]